MFGVIVKVELPEGSTFEQRRENLERHVIPAAKQRPGLMSAYWLSPPAGNDGLGVMIFSDEASARAAAAQVQTPPGVTLIDVEVREVAGSI